MSFFHIGREADQSAGGLPVNLLHQHECSLCPLDRQAGNLCHPKMDAYGAARPRLYALGEAPGRQEDEQGRPFVGPAGQLLRRYLPNKVGDQIRWNNTIRCRPVNEDGANRQPDLVEIECCRPSIERDIELARPTAILGFGGVPLKWITGDSGILRWAGRKTPVKVRSHTCWYFPLMHPSYILHQQNDGKPKSYGRAIDLEFTFGMQLRRAVHEATNGITAPVIHDQKMALDGIEIVTGERGERDLERVADFLQAIWNEPAVGYDFETRKFRPFSEDAKLLSVAFAGRKRAMGIAWKHREAKWTKEQRQRLRELLTKFILAKDSPRLVSHHLTFELEWTHHLIGPEAMWGGKWEDSEAQAFIIDERPYTSSLDFLSRLHFGLDLKAISNVDRNNLDLTPLSQVLTYNALDARYHRANFLAQDQTLRQEKLLKVYRHQVERIIVATQCQIRGVPVDLDKTLQLKQDYEAKIKAVEKEIWQQPGIKEYNARAKAKGGFSPSARQDVEKYLASVGRYDFEKMDEATLREIDDPVIKLVRRYRKLSKVLSTYILPIEEKLHADNKLHQILHICRTRTNRSSSEGPNLQNFPKRDAAALEARRQIAAGPDEVMVAFDYAGMQARNIAMESNDAKLVQAFHDHYDIHADWLERIIKRWPQWEPKNLRTDKKVFAKYRHKAKNELVFPSFFGAHGRSVARYLGVPENVGIDLQEAFWDEHPGVKKWQKRTIATYKECGYVTGLSGFRRHAPVAVNELINSPIQSDEALLVFDAMIRLGKRGIVCNMEIHDDLTFIWKKKKLDQLTEITIGEMLYHNYDWINVPLGIEMSVGPNWGEMEKVGEYESTGRDTWTQIKK